MFDKQARGLELLDATDWSRLYHALGWATDTPGHLRALLDLDPEGRKAALAHLRHAVFHQETPFSATAPAALVICGFLAESAIDAGEKPVRKELLAFLTAVAAVPENSGLTLDEVERLAAAHDIDRLADIRSAEGPVSDDDQTVNDALYAHSILACRRAAPEILAALKALNDEKSPARISPGGAGSKRID